MPVNMPDGPLLEAAICADHHRQIETGAAWDWNWDRGEILMGSDATPRLKDFTIESRGDRSELGIENVILTLDLGRDGETVDLVRVRMTMEEVKELISALDQFQPPAG